MATISTGKTFTDGELVTPAKLHQLVDSAQVSGIVNADIAPGAAIADTKLATITTPDKVSPAAVTGLVSDFTTLATVVATHTHDDRYYTETEIDSKLAGLPVSGHTHSAADITSGTLANARTTATNANTANAIVARDASGNFSAGTITANLTGNVTGNASGSAATWATARNLTLTGDVTATLSSVNGSANVSAAATIANGAVTTAKLATATQQSLVPAGAIMPFAMGSAPSGWLAADGTEVSRTTYATLFAAIGTTHGTGNGSTTFNLPDLRGLFVRGSGSQTFGGSTYTGTFASKNHDTFESHNHGFSGTLSVNPVVSVSASEAGNTATSGSAGRVTSVNTTTSTASISGSTSINGAGETAPANIALLYCIKF